MVALSVALFTNHAGAFGAMTNPHGLITSASVVVFATVPFEANALLANALSSGCTTGGVTGGAAGGFAQQARPRQETSPHLRPAHLPSPRLPSPGPMIGTEGLSKGYLLGPGDEITGKVLGEEEFGFTAYVNADGNIMVPFFDKPIVAMCRTEKALRADLIMLLQKQLRNPQFSIGPITAYFCANVDDIIDRYQPALWIYGHNHFSNDLQRGATRLVSNQMGYPREAGSIPVYAPDKTIILS